MSVISLETAKKYLDVIHNSDDDKLQMLLDAAEDEAAQYMNRPLPEILAEIIDGEVVVVDPPVLPPSVVLGVMLLLQAAYQASPDDVPKLRDAAEIKLTPYRVGMGV